MGSSVPLDYRNPYQCSHLNRKFKNRKTAEPAAVDVQNLGGRSIRTTSSGVQLQSFEFKLTKPEACGGHNEASKNFVSEWR